LPVFQGQTRQEGHVGHVLKRRTTNRGFASLARSGRRRWRKLQRARDALRPLQSSQAPESARQAITRRHGGGSLWIAGGRVLSVGGESLRRRRNSVPSAKGFASHRTLQRFPRPAAP
jgi:hypothetical protein